MAILPNSNLGIFGGGQLGRMFVVAARTMGYGTVVFDSDCDSPAGSIADQHICASYDDEAALNQFAETCAAITIEFENIPVDALNKVRAKTRVAPTSDALNIVQDRCLEKEFLNQNGIGTVAFQPITKLADIAQAESLLNATAILKTAQLGYDGKGQYVVDSVQAAENAFAELGSCACILEEEIDFKCELSVVVARAENGQSVCYPPAENKHRNGILHSSKVPSVCSSEIKHRAKAMAKKSADALGYCGVMAVEFFVTHDGELLANEIAPRPHNSGHYTIDACSVSQFEQQVRMMCGLPLGEVCLSVPVIMVNILGDVWGDDGTAPNWRAILHRSNARLHLYGKKTPRGGRKMGHFCVWNQDLGRAEREAEDIYRELVGETDAEDKSR